MIYIKPNVLLYRTACMISVLASGAVDRGFVKLLFVASPLSSTNELDQRLVGSESGLYKSYNVRIYTYINVVH
jgi:hypothetical protein